MVPRRSEGAVLCNTQTCGKSASQGRQNVPRPVIDPWAKVVSFYVEFGSPHWTMSATGSSAKRLEIGALEPTFANRCSGPPSLSNGKIEKRGLSPTGSGIQQVDPLMFAGFLVILASLKFLVLFDWKRKKEMPMRKAFMSGVRSVSETFWTIGATSVRSLPLVLFA